MNRFTLLILLIGFRFLSVGQTVVYYDYMEAFTWPCFWLFNTPTSGYYTNASVTPNSSAAIYGSGNGTSSYESNIYILPNITGLNSSSEYTLRFRLGSYRFSGPTATTAGLDAADYLELSVSTNGGVSYASEIRITGFGNAYWNYNTAGSIIKVPNGTMTTYSPAAGGNRTTTGDGYSTITLAFMPGVTQLAARIFVRANSTGEEWWIDNIELLETADPGLPIELVSLEGLNKDGVNIVKWSTATEFNNDYYRIEKSEDGINWRDIGIVEGAGNSTEQLWYEFLDYGFEKGIINYYRLNQHDYDGAMKVVGAITINNRIEEKKVLKIVDMSGKEVTGELVEGIYIKIFEDGTMVKIIR
jgi:hypothetical protein